MFKYFVHFLLLTSFITGYGQRFSGQWKGSFVDNSPSYGFWGADTCDYVLELDLEDNKVNGTSYTYFTENGKKFYTICKVAGTVDLKKKYIEVRETERTKTNIPNNVSNCLQIHKLTYFKQGNTETLEGNWTPSPNQKGNCGYGTTYLTRRSLINSYPNLISKNSHTNNNQQKSEKLISQSPVAKSNQPKNQQKTQIIKDKIDELSKKITSEDQAIIENTEPEKKGQDATFHRENNDISKLEKRKSKLLKTIEVENKMIKIDLYDNGEVDGDSISLYYNKKLLLSNKRLSEKAISLKLSFDDDNEVNELVMYAENLGTIPPNTALMIVTDGPNRYEVRITSDFEKSGVIRFILKPTPH